jgi:hypothetical protein
MAIPTWLRWRISLRCLFVLITAACLPLGWVVNRAHPYERVAATLEGMDGVTPIFDDMLDADGCWTEEEPADQSLTWLEYVPEWLGVWLEPLVIYRCLAVVGADFEQQPREAAWQSLESLPRVRSLSLSGDWVNDETLHRVLTFRGLQSLMVSSKNVTEAGLNKLAALAELRQVGLQCPQVRSESLSFLARLPRLKHLYVHGPPLLPSVLEQLVGRQQLEVLRASGPELTVETAAILPLFPRLRQVWLQESPLEETHAQLCHARQKLPDLSLFIYRPSLGDCIHLPSLNERKQAGMKISDGCCE